MGTYSSAPATATAIAVKEANPFHKMSPPLGAVSKGTFCIKKYTRENDPPGLETYCSLGGRAAGRWGRGREASPFSPSPPVL